MIANKFQDNWNKTQYKDQARNVYLSSFFIVIFYSILLVILGYYWYLLINILIVSAILTSLYANKKSKHALASLIFIIVCSLTTGAYSVIFGFISNFLFYAFLMTSLTIFTNWKRSTKFHIMVCLGAVYILCGILTYYYGPLEDLSIELQMVFMIINLVFCMAGVARTTAFFFNTTKEAHEQLAILASTDSLTGLPNRTSFVYTYEKLRDENETGIGLMMIDTDDFKIFNDTYGHIYGDEILQTVSEVFKSVKQANHYIARYGGEEFTVLVRSNDVNEVYQFAELLRNKVIEIGNSIDKQLSISIGLVYMPLHYMGHPNLISIADELLYQAKSEGKNKIVSKVLGL